MHGLTGAAGNGASATVGAKGTRGNPRARAPRPPAGQRHRASRLPSSGSRAPNRRFASLDGWLRRRLRQVRWKEWKSTAAKRHNLRIRGISENNARKWAGNSRRYWPAGMTAASWCGPVPGSRVPGRPPRPLSA